MSRHIQIIEGREHVALCFGDSPVDVAPPEPDPWRYAIYHCRTAANLYSSVHWSYCGG